MNKQLAHFVQGLQLWCAEADEDREESQALSFDEIHQIKLFFNRLIHSCKHFFVTLIFTALKDVWKKILLFDLVLLDF